MKFNKILEVAEKTFSRVKLGGKKSDPKLAELDRGVLTVGFLVAALDGTILPEEYTALSTLAKKCRGGSAKNVRAVVDAALPTAGQLVTMAQVGVYTEKERLEAFLAAAAKALPRGFANGSMADLRRAFALWVAVAVADGVFSSIEKAAISMLGLRYAAVAAKKAKKGAAKAFRLLEPDFLVKAEKIARDLAAPAKKAKAEASLDALIAFVPTVDGKGGTTRVPASGVAVRLVAMAMLGIVVTEPRKTAWNDEALLDKLLPKVGDVSMTSDFFIKLDGIDGNDDHSKTKWIEVMDFAYGSKRVAGGKWIKDVVPLLDDLSDEDLLIRGCMNGQKIIKT